jgi:dienelactone hydrolase
MDVYVTTVAESVPSGQGALVSSAVLRAVRGTTTVLGVLVLLALLSPRADAQGVSIHMHSGEGYAADGVLFEPTTGEPPFAAILLIPDNSGLSDRVTDTAQTLSVAGYFVTVVDLNRGQPPDTAKPSNDQAMHDLNAAVAFLSKQPRVRHDCIGALGWQSGALYALKLAAKNPEICAVAIREASPPKNAPKLSSSKTAVMANSETDAEALRARTLSFFKTNLADRH